MNTQARTPSSSQITPGKRSPTPFLPSLTRFAAAERRARFEAFANLLDLSAIKYKLIRENGWTLERANAVEPQYKAFFFLLGTKTKGEFVPTYDIDQMWHGHVLDTRKYMSDCAEHFGCYVHHYPYLGMKDDADEARAHQLFNATCSFMHDALGITVESKVELSSCGGGCGGHGCGGHGCSSGHSSCGTHSSCSTGSHDSGHGTGNGHGHDNGNADNSITPLISSCSDNTPASNRREPTRPTRPSQTPEKKRGILRRILDLTANVDYSDWYMSVTPEFFDPLEFRPNDAALKAVVATKSVH